MAIKPTDKKEIADKFLYYLDPNGTIGDTKNKLYQLGYDKMMIENVVWESDIANQFKNPIDPYMKDKMFKNMTSELNTQENLSDPDYIIGRIGTYVKSNMSVHNAITKVSQLGYNQRIIGNIETILSTGKDYKSDMKVEGRVGGVDFTKNVVTELSFPNLTNLRSLFELEKSGIMLAPRGDMNIKKWV